MRLREYLTLVFLVDQLGLAGTLCCYAGQEEPAGPAAQITPSESDGGLIERWLEMVARVEAEGPDWVSPLVTVTPRLIQQLR
jgi:hypothetical protein